MTLFFSLVTAHLIADFLQPSALVKWAKRSTYGLIVHVTIYSLLSAVVLLGYPFWWLWLIVVGLSHFLIDRVKYRLSDIARGFELHLFLGDQALHVSVVGLVALIGNYLRLPAGSSIFINLINHYSRYLPFIVAYLSGTFATSILVFEADRTYAVHHGATNLRLIVTFKDRIKGMIERALGMTFIVTNLFYLFPFAFSFSIVQLYNRWKSKTGYRRAPAIELAIGVFISLLFGIVLRFF